MGNPTRRAALAGASGAGLLPVEAAQAAAEPVWSGEYEATKERNGQAIRLQMYRKRVGAPQGGEARRPVLFLVHGSSPSAMTSFDLSVPGHGDYSAMDAFARYGFDVWTMDHENYGRSARTDGNSDIGSGVADLVAGTAVVERETGLRRLHMLGESSGALRAGRSPWRSRTALAGWCWKRSPTPARARPP